MNASIASLEEELESSRDCGERWRMQLDVTAQELQKTAQESVSYTLHILYVSSHLITSHLRRVGWL